ncbi:MAG: ATP-binding domain-containing protein [bacterium]
MPDWIAESDHRAITLDKNVRNTENIGRAALKLGDIEEDIQFGHEGQPTQFSLTDSGEQIVDELRKALHEIFVEEDLNPSDSVILARHKKENSPLAGVDTLGNFTVSEEPGSGNQTLQYSTIHSYKGLEADVVFLLVPEWDQQHAQAFYTGATRPKHLLWIFSADPMVEQKLSDVGVPEVTT